MAPFVGRHVNRIDKKGRVSVPRSFRAALGDQPFSGIYVFPQFKHPALEACGGDFMERIADALDDLPMFSDDQDDLSIILENAHALAFDGEGRVVLPAELLEAAGVEGEALFVGRGARFQIWNPEIYQRVRGPAFERARERGLTLSLKRRPSGHGEG